MKQQPIRVAMMAFVVFGLLGCAQINDTAFSLVSSGVSAVAIVDGQRMQGEMQVFPNRTGNVRLRAVDTVGSPAGPLTACMGRLRYTAASTGAVGLLCNGGRHPYELVGRDTWLRLWKNGDRNCKFSLLAFRARKPSAS